MRFHTCLLAAGVLLWGGGTAAGQTLVQSPAGLSTIPKGATRANPYWQHLVIDLTYNPAAGSTIAIDLPAGVTVADVDEDSSLADEVSTDNPAGANTGYNSADGTTASRILLTSPAGGLAGPVHLQFPITTQASPTSSTVAYGVVSFTYSREKTIPAGTLILTYAEAYDLGLASFSRLFVDGVADTTTDLQGDRYPASPAPAFAASLPDLLSDQAGSLASEFLARVGVPFGDHSDSDDVAYRFWFSSHDSLSRVDTTTAVLARDSATGQPARAHEGGLASIAFEVSGLAQGTYYLYLTCDLTGSFPLTRSRGIAVRHRPVVLSVGSFLSDNADYLDSGLLLDFDTGQPGPVSRARDQVDLVFAAVDVDDSAYVRLFYATADTLDTSFVRTTGTSPSRSISGLRNATDVDSTAHLREGRDRRLTWHIDPSPTQYVAAGNYYIYAVATDGKDLAVGRSAYQYRVRHSPYMAFDTRRNQTLNTGGDQPQRYYTITWNQDNGVDGDIDRDDNASIALYYSATDTFRVPGGAQALVAAAADPARDIHLIKSGLTENPDGRDDNQYVWDLWSYTNPDDGKVPREGVPYCLYSVVADGTTSRLVRWDDEAGQARRLTFVHRPYLRVRAPLAPLAVDGRQSFQVSWVAQDLDDKAGIWVLLTPQAAGQALGETSTYGELRGDGAPDWVANSADGSLASGQPLVEGQTVEYAVRPYRMSREAQGQADPLRNGEYWVYVVIDEKNGRPPSAASPAFRAPGLVSVAGLGPEGAAGLESATLELLPASRTMTLRGDTARFELRPYTQGQAVDVLACFLNLDTLYFRLVDQDTARSGIQPFAVDSALPGMVLADTVRVGTDSTTVGKWLLDLVYFEQSGTARFDGEVPLAALKLVSKNTAGTARLGIDNFRERQTAFYRQGALVAGLPPSEAARVSLVSRGSVSGRVRLQGRTNHRSLATFFLRDRNNTVPIADSLFRVTNDSDSTRAGIQDSTDAEGRFTLSQVPTGEYHLAVHVDRYLDGQYPDLRVYPGAQLTGIDPVVLADGKTSAGALLGGDVTGYVDTSGTSLPDNEVDQLDVDLVVAYFGRRVSTFPAGRMADVDGDSLVWVPDLNLVAANFGRPGVEPVYRSAGTGAGAGQARLRLVPVAGTGQGELVVDVLAEGLEGMRAYGFRLLYDDRLLFLTSHTSGEVFGSRPAVHASREEQGEIALGGALLGQVPGVSGRGCLARVCFAEKTGAEEAHLALAGAELVDQDQQRLVPALEQALPALPALLPNYPNPFNPQTAIRVALTRDSEVVLEVYDVAGQRVCSLSSGWLAAGLHTFVWDGRDSRGQEVGSGVYFARLRAQEFSAVRKMLLLR